MYDGLIFPAPPRTYKSSSFHGSLYHIPRNDHDTVAAWLPFRGGGDVPRRVLLYAHANAVDIGDMFEELTELGRQLCVHVLAVEYTGYGIIGGSASEQAVIEDVFAAYNFLTKTMKFHPRNIVCYGRSIGTGPLTVLAASLPVGGLILKTPFTSIKECVGSLVGRQAGGLGGIAASMVGNRFPTIETLPRVMVPILIVHGTEDEIVPYEHALRLQVTCPTTTTLVSLPGYGHNNIPLSQVVPAIAPYLKALPEAHADTPLAVPPPGLMCRGESVTPRRAADLSMADALASPEALVEIIMANCVAFAACAATLLCHANKEKAKSGTHPVVPVVPAAMIDLALALWGSPWVGVDLAGGVNFETFLTASGRYEVIREGLESWVPGTGPVPMAKQWFVPVYSCQPHRTLKSELALLVRDSANSSSSQQPTDKLLFEIERYVRNVPPDTARVVGALLDGGAVLPAYFRGLEVRGLEEPSSTKGGMPVPPDAAYVNGLLMALHGSLTIMAMDGIREAHAEFAKEFQNMVYFKCRDEPTLYVLEKRKGGGDCIVM